jgi:hypothetical protein
VYTLTATLLCMTTLRVIDSIGNKTDYDAASIPRIGERIELTYKIGDEPMSVHFFRVKDVVYKLQSPIESQVGILVEEEKDPREWPS